ncbi:MAG: hypothetical protein KC736_03805 [Candidatus Moranbacteria bacterium]|nr:hypothetical protein [Candidatus Moranbacteria bacterium]
MNQAEKILWQRTPILLIAIFILANFTNERVGILGVILSEIIYGGAFIIRAFQKRRRFCQIKKSDGGCCILVVQDIPVLKILPVIIFVFLLVIFDHGMVLITTMACFLCFFVAPKKRVCIETKQET